MKRNRLIGRVVWLAMLLTIVGFVIFGCGGGGGGSTGSTAGTTASNATGTTSGTVVNVNMVTVYRGTQSPTNYTPSLIQGAPPISVFGVGDVIQLEYVGVLSSNHDTYKVVAGSNASTNAPSTVAAFSGNQLTILKASSSNYTISGSYGGTSFTITFTTVAKMAKVSGKVIDPGGHPVVGAIAVLLNSSTRLGTSTTGIDGTFICEAPVNANAFTVDFANLRSLYYNEFAYGSLYYAATITTCGISLPSAVSLSKTVAVANTVVPFYYDPNSPPPAPDGCT